MPYMGLASRRARASSGNRRSSSTDTPHLGPASSQRLYAGTCLHLQVPRTEHHRRTRPKQTDFRPSDRLTAHHRRVAEREVAADCSQRAAYRAERYPRGGQSYSSSSLRQAVHAQPYANGTAGQRFTGYELSQRFTIESTDVEAVESVSREISPLIAQRPDSSQRALPPPYEARSNT